MQEEKAKNDDENKLPTKPSDLAVIPDYAPLATEEEHRVNTPPEKPEPEPLANKITQPIQKTNNNYNTSKDTTTAAELVEDEFQVRSNK